MLTNQILVVTVSQLNREVKDYLENEVGSIHVEGEVSNLTKASSGHYYFILKDGFAQLRCVFFKNRHTNFIPNQLKDGKKIIASGSLSLYEARGDYQLIVEQLTEAGIGALYQLIEEIKIKLAAEGLFDQVRKKPLPAMPKAIGIISSPTGAALKDILSTLGRRFPQAELYIYPSEVQGINAVPQLIKAIQHANADNQIDVLILARGGGSIEDLWAFNDEHLAREIAKSTIPIITGVGHETDVTLVDFVADYRAETPTAAAIAASPDCIELINFLNKALLRLFAAINRIRQSYQIKLKHLVEKIASPKRAISSYWQSLDYFERQLIFFSMQRIQRTQNQLRINIVHLNSYHPKAQISHEHSKLALLIKLLVEHMSNKLRQLHHRFRCNLSTLEVVSPLATINRGYAIASKENHIIYDAGAVNINDSIEVRLAKGQLICRVLSIAGDS